MIQSVLFVFLRKLMAYLGEFTPTLLLCSTWEISEEARGCSYFCVQWVHPCPQVRLSRLKWKAYTRFQKVWGAYFSWQHMTLLLFSVPGKSWDDEAHKLLIWKPFFQPPEHQTPLPGITTALWWFLFSLLGVPAAGNWSYCRHWRACWAISLSVACVTLHIRCNFSHVRWIFIHLRMTHFLARKETTEGLNTMSFWDLKSKDKNWHMT